jgi:hypothetical protein
MTIRAVRRGALSHADELNQPAWHGMLHTQHIGATLALPDKHSH